MADVSKVVNLKIFSWGRPSAANPRLAAPISSAATTITEIKPNTALIPIAPCLKDILIFVLPYQRVKVRYPHCD